MRIELNNSLDQIASAMDALQAFSDSVALDEDARHSAELVLDEFLCNIISYGLADTLSGSIVLELDVVAENLQIRITDSGIPFNPFERPDPNLDLPLEECQPGGLGIYLVRKFMDEYEYEYRDRHNIVTLRKKLAA